MMYESEIPLAGGNVSDGVVRVGQTTRRSQGSWSPAVQALLRHLEARGFTGAPRFLGVDERGREILSYIEGEMGHYPLRDAWWSQETMVEVARFVRRYHDAVSDFVPPPDARWKQAFPDAATHEIICHNDIAPYNMVYLHDRPHALIDFDEAGPGPRTWDLAYAAYCFVPLVHSADADLQRLGLTDPARQGRRLRLFCASYGIDVLPVLEMVEPRLQRMHDTIIERAADTPAFQKMIEEGHLDFYRSELETYRRIRPVLERAALTDD
ncbi:phosphotransferase [Dictyobacter aurantiacus]|uniref:Trifolitoxin immunity domain-containing protein n=1 Tax=Dictyobacter aurantiacus TaxID=1936993 RepID=A0A401ZJZ4_9CHLR|nr:phosphotransferase [Dictyobacter aurantiacus]GCE07171.1 trifolitoxin immunity domain-containing protein [Dictyobacter aurantiacus]